MGAYSSNKKNEIYQPLRTDGKAAVKLKTILQIIHSVA